MLLEFTVGNYRSFHEPCTLSMLATHLKGLSEEVDARNVATLADGRRVLRVAVLYGPNAGGKSNFIRAMEVMNHIVHDSARLQADAPLPVEPFLLSTLATAEPSHFESVFVVEGIQYRYGFEATREEIKREWLYHRPKAREAMLFEREGQEIRHSGVFSEGRAVLGLLSAISPGAPLRRNALFLSMAAQANGPVASLVVRWFRTRLVLSYRVSARTSRIMRGFSAWMVQGAPLPTPRLLLAILDRADVGIREFSAQVDAEQEPEPNDSQPTRADLTKLGIDRDWNVNTIHFLRDGSGVPLSEVKFDLDEHESTGTQKLFDLAGFLVAVLEAGDLLAADELDARLHPLLTRAIVGLFQDPEVNPKDAQLIFATHDDGLLEPEVFRRDQIWFVEKDRDEASTLRSLAEYRGVRGDRSYRVPYLEGRFGAIPILRRFGKV